MLTEKIIRFISIIELTSLGTKDSSEIIHLMFNLSSNSRKHDITSNLYILLMC